MAAQAGLGYGTLYHYYSNKGDLHPDLLWDALERAGELLKAPLEVLRAAASGEAAAGGHFGLAAAAAADTGSLAAADSRSRGSDTAAADVRLLQLWAEDRALYLLYKLAGEDFAWLPEARSSSLSAAVRREVLAPLGALLETGRAADGAAASRGNAAGRRISCSARKCCWPPWPAAPRFRFAAECCAGGRGYRPVVIIIE
ncbi:hypothetical protein SK3146_04352 [Paenibacillus konkukensis]|uniref:HTH tetR-type domain-containing protein n=1 Tax=Paenibacillus konkukensis TaxID=2020716 RepID=A0ABY4RTL7_9BACL|nr:hypothetical protein SK3146_04352 [Paenibacillus konkukensis]